MRSGAWLRGSLLAGLVTVWLPAVAVGATIQTIEMTCPYDGTKFEFVAQMSGTSFGSALDGMPMGAIRSPWPLAVCPTNGFVFLKESYTDEELERLRPLVLSPEYQGLRDEAAYYRAAWISERSGSTAREVAHLFLQSSWEVGQAELIARYRTRLGITEGMSYPEAAKLAEQDRDHSIYRQVFAEGTLSDRWTRYAREALTRYQASVNAEGDDKFRTYSNMVIGELLRRLRQFDEAAQHFGTFASGLAPSSNEGRIVAFQLDRISKADAGFYTTDDVFPRPAPRASGDLKR
jgi:hypothetical protein